MHVDIDPAEISKIRVADVPIVGDAKDVIIDLIAAYGDAVKAGKPDLSEWSEPGLEFLKEQYPLGYNEPEDGLLSPQYVIERIGAITGPEGIYAAGVVATFQAGRAALSGGDRRSHINR